MLVTGPDPFFPYEVVLTEPSRVESSLAVTTLPTAIFGNAALEVTTWVRYLLLRRPDSLTRRHFFVKQKWCFVDVNMASPHSEIVVLRETTA